VLSCIIGDERATAGSYLATVDGGRTDLLALPDAQRRRLRVDGMAPSCQNAADGLD
jgi:alpha-D-ribose 1-methylphosphonate 5-phosphate C-P lyase